MSRIRRLTVLALLVVGAPAAAIDYPTGDACLFCHRNEIGSTWLDNAHAWTIRPVGEPPPSNPVPADATHVIGKDPSRALKQLGYGKFAVLSNSGRWQDDHFARQCAGCHTTAVDAASGEFAAIGLDCYACHGNVPENHAEKRGTTLLSRARESNAREIASICGACHLRGATSQASGLPYPTAFVAGADLFADFKVDLQRDLKSLDDSDRHVYETTRALLEGKTEDTCVDCHRIHMKPEANDPERKRFSEICGY